MAGITKLDDRQIKFLENYLNPKSKFYCNALQSALKAGYSQEYAENITGQMPDWLSEAIRKEERLSRVEKVFDEALNVVATKNGKTDASILRVKTDVAKFLAETIGKDKGYTKRSELTGKDGDPLVTNTIILKDFNGTDSK
jgi:hypothetical protein